MILVNAIAMFLYSLFLKLQTRVWYSLLDLTTDVAFILQK